MSFHKDKIYIFDINIDILDRYQSIEACRGIIEGSDNQCQYVVTPNVDHIITLQKNKNFKIAYAEAALVLADGNPIVWASKILGKPLPETVTGSDLVPALMESYNARGENLSVFLLGAGPGVAEKAAEEIKKNMPHITVCGCYSPPFGFEKQASETDKIIHMVNQAAPQLLVIGLGAPKQEVWINRNYKSLNAKLAICAGAVIDFMAGEKPRAPKWMQKFALEWLHRMLSEPRRLALRYAKGAILFPMLIMKELLRNK